jgi:cobalt-zinc-cadmium resistance protein CzcA
LWLVAPLALALVLFFLFLVFRSLRDGLIVFTGIPFALLGGIGALWLRGYPFSITAAVGMIALSGVAILNGLVLVSAMKKYQQQKESFEEAIIHGAVERLRPVLITALVATLGFLPMALATGTGSEVQKPLATVVLGGILTSTLLTLIVLPVLYRMLGSHKEAKAS